MTTCSPTEERPNTKGKTESKRKGGDPNRGADRNSRGERERQQNIRETAERRKKEEGEADTYRARARGEKSESRQYRQIVGRK